MRLRSTPRFEKAFKVLAAPLQKRARKSLEQFLENPRHAHLHFEKLSTDYRTIKVDQNFRIVLREVEPGLFDLVDVDSHSRVYNRYG